MSGDETIRSLRLHATERDGWVRVRFLHHDVELTPLQARHLVRELLSAVHKAEPDPRRPRIEVVA